MQRFNDINSLQKTLVSDLLRNGLDASPRGMRTLESLGYSFVLEDPRNRLLTIEKRKWNLPLALGELCWHCSGSSDAKSLSFYAKQWGNFAELDGTIKGSCYGKNGIANQGDTPSQWDQAKALLKSDPNSRRAILFFNLAENRLSPDAVDVACVSSMQFLIREDRLHVFVCMRSNDAIWGVPYDVFLFSWLQERMAAELGVELGFYHHTATSMHLYERHFGLAEEILGASEFADPAMPPITDLSFLKDFIASEKKIRSDAEVACLPESYWQDLTTVLAAYSKHKTQRNPIPTLTTIHHAPYRNLLERQIGL